MASKIAACLILGCALLGGYASMFTTYQHGFFDALRICTTDGSLLSPEPCVLDMSGSISSFSKTITGIAPVDSLIHVLLEFFSQGLRSDPDAKGIDLEALLAFGYLAAQFGGAWYLMALEGLRLGNRGTILSWTGTFGIVFQAVTITIIAPIYLTLQLLSSPSVLQLNSILADPCDLALLPVSTVISYVLPTVGLCLPLLNVLSREAKYIAIALWQPFPLYQTAIRGLSHLFCRTRQGKANNTAHINPRECRKALGRAYSFITSLTLSVHLVVMGTLLASATTDLVPTVSAHHVLALTSLTSPPTLAMLDPPVPATSSREIVVSFLRWDVYCTCASMLVWSGYQLYAVRGSPSVTVMGLKAVKWALVGGPIFPALMLLWERDDIVMDKLELSRSYQKEE
ncbi:hypothetical protein EDB81DRAFT_785516 [Dactylonectria macrodidyma]|uniref:Uncharacterized protein n=1 Tax=Dactylonectria macrodidyma TaxID=307937 RepID=A0A9P9FH75_9HYPO|nr:hypothetical protein EDB81DRAFT_785516 [Dactylonectria macrodidyma]